MTLLFPEYFIEYLGAVLDAFGVIIIVWGALFAVIGLLNAEVNYFFHKKKSGLWRKSSLDFVNKMIVSLDFFIAGDIVKLLIIQETEVLIRLAIIVGIRAVLGYFLSREIDQESKRR